MGGDFDLTVSFTKGMVDLGAYDTTAKIFVESSIIGATIKVNGIIRGETPNLVEGLNPGSLLLEVEKDGSYGSKQINLAAKSFDQINLNMTKATGNILVGSINTYDNSYKVKSKVNNVSGLMDNMKVWIDGKEIINHKSGLIRALPPGGRDIIIKGDGWYFEDRVTIKPNDAVKINIDLEPVGDLEVVSMDGAIVKLKSTDGYEIIAEPSIGDKSELLDMPVGKWAVTIEKTVDYRDSSTFSLNIAIGALGASAVGFTIPLFLGNNPKSKVIKPTIDNNQNRIIELEAELKELK